MKYIFGVDVGGTAIKFGLFTDEGELKESWSVETGVKEGHDIVEKIGASCLDRMAIHGIDREDVLGIGVGVPGPVSAEGVVNGCVNLGWAGVKRNLKKEIEEVTGLTADIGNDANAAAYGEFWMGAAKGRKDIALITLGTGIGGGIIVNGEMVHGTLGYGGEIGHLTMNPKETLVCNCKKKGCLEQYCSATGIVRLAKEALPAWEGDSCLKKIPSEELDARAIFDAAKEGDAFALSRVEVFGEMLGLACSYIAGITNPEVFVIGGGVSAAGRIITDTIKKHYDRYAFADQNKAEFITATLGNAAGIYGAAAMVLFDKNGGKIA